MGGGDKALSPVKEHLVDLKPKNTVESCSYAKKASPGEIGSN